MISRRGRYGGATEIENKEFYKYPFPITGPNEALLMGARSPYPFNGGDDWIVTRPDNWMFTGTGMKKGDRIPGLVGWEFHGDPANIPGLEIVAEGVALSGGVRPVRWTATVYPGPKRTSSTMRQRSGGRRGFLLLRAIFCPGHTVSVRTGRMRGYKRSLTICCIGRWAGN